MGNRRLEALEILEFEPIPEDGLIDRKYGWQYFPSHREFALKRDLGKKYPLVIGRHVTNTDG